MRNSEIFFSAIIFSHSRRCWLHVDENMRDPRGEDHACRFRSHPSLPHTFSVSARGRDTLVPDL